MIRIIKEGVKPKKYKTIYTLQCKNCKCEFEFDESECNSVYREKRPGGKLLASINCPCCNCDISCDLEDCDSRKEEVTEEIPNTINIDPDINCVWNPTLHTCPKCGSHNTLRNDTLVLTTWPVQYNFKCEDCGHRWTGHEQTLINPKVYDPWDNEHCNNCPNKNLIGDMCSFCSHSPYKVTYTNGVKE